MARRLALGVALCLSVCLAPALGATATTNPTSAVAAQDAEKARVLLALGIEQAVAGRFDEAASTIATAATLAPNDAQVSTAQGLLANYRTYCGKAEAVRAAEYAAAVERVGWGVISEAYQPKLAAAKVDKKLQDKARDVMTALTRAGNSETLEDIARDNGDEIKAKSIKEYGQAATALAELVKLLPETQGQYTELVEKTVASLAQRMQACKQVWVEVDPSSASSRKAAAKALKALEDPLGEDLADLAQLTSDKPWREAMLRARMAKNVASPKDKITEQGWYTALIKDLEKRGEEFIKDAQWSDALTVYAGLDSIDETNEHYKSMLKQVRRHVRVLRLYGKEKPEEDSAAETKPADQEPTWQEYVEGVDSDMAEKAISQLDTHYVTAVDYRKLTRGALLAAKVLAQTPQAADSFPGLADPAKRDAFVKDIDEQLAALDGRERVDHLDLTLAMNNVLRSSERTIGVPTEVLVVELVDGFMDELDDFSAMIWPHDVADFEKQTMGHYYGIGVQITKEPGEPLKVVTPLAADTPAFKAGIKSGDLVLAVDGRATEDLGIEKLMRMITGEKGTKVVLRIKRAGRVEPFDVALTREEINIGSVRGWQRKADGQWDYTLNGEGKVGYIRIMQFSEQTPGDIDQALAQLSEQGVKSLILDVRFNPGGLLRSATEVADEFLKIGRLVSTEGRQTPRQAINAEPGGKYLDGDLIVLVNNTSASAAEILSGALKDWSRGIVVGQRSFGKGSVQNVIPIRYQRAVLKLTTAYYYLPSGRLVHKRNGQKDWGVDPDVELNMTPRQTRRWLDIRAKTDLLHEIDPQELRNELVRQYDADIQLHTAVLLLKLKQLQEGRLLAPPMTAAAEAAK
ncbi:MAG: S41 family peptidase [Phycisphaerae bacterium]